VKKYSRKRETQSTIDFDILTYNPDLIGKILTIFGTKPKAFQSVYYYNQREQNTGLSMKKIRWFIILFFPVLLCACSLNNQSTPTVDAPGTFTAVAKTLNVGEPTITAAVPATSIPPTNTATPLITTSFPTIQIITTQTNTPYPYISWTPSTCDKSSFTKDITVPDDTKFYPGTKFTKTWRIYNSGTCTWTKEYRLQYISGNQMGADTIYLPKSVAPGEYLDISLDMTAPNEPEDYSNFWRLRNKTGLIFGETFYVVIEVTKGAQTLTPTPSMTYTATTTLTATPITPSPTATNTTIPTETPLPTDTPAPTTEVPTEAPTEEPTATGGLTSGG
jgi:hypothetical protein